MMDHRGILNVRQHTTAVKRHPQAHKALNQKNDVDGATMLPDGNAETNKQEAGKDTGHNEQVDPNYQTPVRNTTVSKNGFFQSRKTRKSNFTIIRHISLL